MALVTIWGDESCQNAHQYMVLGTIWENTAFTADFERDVHRLKQEMNFYKEFHWSEMKGHQRCAYKGLVDIFNKYMRQGSLKFRALVVDMSDSKNKREGDDEETHFYKMFYWLIYKKLRTGHRYDIYLDRKSNSVPGRYQDLERYLNNRMVQDYIMNVMEEKGARHPFVTASFPNSVVRRVEPRDGAQVQLQLADVFAGAIGYVKNGSYANAKQNYSKNAKVDVVDHIEKTLQVSLSACHYPNESEGFNIWCFQRK
ncbi:DUF3800 domain-containing protein [Paenactinomyces guangxiensis]|uniref:DUF3800 domain-containing protein n=1 Tax=Paenactinomyces guangxiensis TaxID=1490290 RepID=A0A7W1WV43_9BACL|nr:DUF3800 domain-containing protein [Paenactinomyces guangxiensis]MBA4496406.1 DUF3800 domain-containing protein [Paenactinomyces guangxiensis]MBH8593477.1 DUF3800 domain-containing protein [Paenactinomyces guangxiensis]